MEGSNILTMLEDVFSGRPGNAASHSELILNLHEALKTANPATLRAAKVVLSRNKDQGKIQEEDYQSLAIYLEGFASGKIPLIPKLAHLTFASNPAALKVSKLFHSLHKIHIKRIRIMASSFSDLKVNQYTKELKSLASEHELEIKRLNCARLVAQLKGALGINMEKTVRIWSNNCYDKNKIIPSIFHHKRKTLSEYNRRQQMRKIIARIIETGKVAFEQIGF